MLGEFKSFFQASQEDLAKLGDGIIEHVTAALKERDKSEVLKVQPKARLKTLPSALAKIVKKQYENPIVQMTDLVGVRFVALLHEDVDLISSIIQAGPWEQSLDREYEKEKLESPTTFTYQSNHFIVTTSANEFTQQLAIPSGLRCEVQVRTLLQHAYSELTHDTIYKPGVVKPPAQAHRMVARSAALIESTDDLFMATITQLRNSEAIARGWFDGLCSLYKEVISPDANEFDPAVNLEFQATYIQIPQIQDLESINAFWRSPRGAAFAERVRGRLDRTYLFTQPMILAIYASLENCQHRFTKLWLFENLNSELDLVFSDMGLSRQN